MTHTEEGTIRKLTLTNDRLQRELGIEIMRVDTLLKKIEQLTQLVYWRSEQDEALAVNAEWEEQVKPILDNIEKVTKEIKETRWEIKSD